MEEYEYQVVGYQSAHNLERTLNNNTKRGWQVYQILDKVVVFYKDNYDYS